MTGSPDRSRELPTTWQMAPLDSLGAWFGGGTPSKDNLGYWNGGGIPWVSPKDMKLRRILETDDHITEEAVRNSATSVVPAGAILMVTRSGILRHTFPVAVAGVDVTLNQDLKALVPAHGLDSAYLAAALEAFGETVLSQCSKDGTTVQSIDSSRLKDFRIPIAPSREQERIVAKMDELFSELDAGVASLKRARALLKKYRQAVLKAAVTGALTCDWRERHKGEISESGAELLQRILQARCEAWEAAELKKLRAKGNLPKDDRWKQKYKQPEPSDTTGLPNLPEGWMWANVSQLFDVQTGSTPKKGRLEYYEGATIPWVTSGAVNQDYVQRPSGYITKKALADTNAKMFPRGSLLLAMYGEGKTRGKISELNIEAATNQALAALITQNLPVITKRFAKIYFKDQYEDFRRLASGGVQPNLNLDIVKRTAVPVPPLMEQEVVVAEAERLLSMIDAVEGSIVNEIRRSKISRRSILRTAFAGMLVPQDPNEEPASVLLERIRAERAAKAKPTRGRRRKAGTGARQLELLR